MATTIQASDRLADELASRKGRGDTYEDVIWRALRAADGAADAAGGVDGAAGETAADGRERIKCEHCGHVWKTASESERPTCSKCTRKTHRVAP